MAEEVDGLLMRPTYSSGTSINWRRKSNMGELGKKNTNVSCRITEVNTRKTKMTEIDCFEAA